jgi:hypothetical protein
MSRHAFAHIALAAASAITGVSTSAQAAVVDHADVNGIRTFLDTGTGLIWADLDQFLVAGATGPAFRYVDRAAYLSALSAAGFQWADWSAVSALTGTVPVSTAAGYADALDAMSTEFGSVVGVISGYADFAPGLSMQWDATLLGWSSYAPNTMPNQLNDSGLWAYYGGSVGGGGSVPAPASLLLAGGALALLAAQRRKTG